MKLSIGNMLCVTPTPRQNPVLSTGSSWRTTGLGGPGWGSAPHPSVQRFDHTFGSPLRPPPRPDEGLSWAETEDDSDGWGRALKGLALVVAIGVAGAALAAGLFVAGRFLVHEVFNYFGTTGL